MAIEFFTGFEGCGSSNDILTLITSVPSNSISYDATNGFDNSKCIQTGENACFTINCTSGKTKTVGFHIKNITKLADTSAYKSICYFIGPDIRICNYSDYIRVYRGTTLLYTSNTFVPSTITHVEVKVFSDGSAGTVAMKINDVQIFSESSLNTNGADITAIGFGSPNNSSYRDNIYIADDFQGELISVFCKPSADDSVQFTPSTGSDNYALVDDTGQDGDTTYVESSTVGHKDIYEFEDIPSGKTIVAATLVTVARKDDAGTRTLQTLSVQDSTERDAGSEYTLATGYPTATTTAIRTTLATCPDSTAWDNTKFNACKWGFKIAS